MKNLEMIVIAAPGTFAKDKECAIGRTRSQRDVEAWTKRFQGKVRIVTLPEGMVDATDLIKQTGRAHQW